MEPEKENNYMTVKKKEKKAISQNNQESKGKYWGKKNAQETSRNLERITKKQSC